MDEELQENHGPAGVKQQLAAVRMMFNWLITGQVAQVKPAAAVRGRRACPRVTTGHDAGARRCRDGASSSTAFQRRCVICGTAH